MNHPISGVRTGAGGRPRPTPTPRSLPLRAAALAASTDLAGHHSAAAPSAAALRVESVGNGDHESDRENGDLLTAGHAARRSCCRSTRCGPDRRHRLGALVVLAGCRRLGRHRRRAAGRRGQLGAGAHQRLPRPEHPRSVGGVYYGFATQNFAAGEPDDQHPGVDLARRRQLDPAQHRRAPDAPRLGQGGQHLGAERGLRQRRHRLRHVLHGDGDLDGRPVHRHGHVRRSRPVPTSTTHRNRSSARTASATALRPSTTQTTAAASTPTSSRTTPATPADLEERRQPPRARRRHHHLVRAAHGQLHARTVGTPDAASAGRRSRGRAASSKAPTWSRPRPRPVRTTTDNYYLFYAGSDEGASTYAIGWASCPAGPAATLHRQVDDGPAPLHRARACRARAGPTSTKCRRIGQLRHGLRRLAGHHHRLPELRHPAHVPGRPHLRAQWPAARRR